MVLVLFLRHLLVVKEDFVVLVVPLVTTLVFIYGRCIEVFVTTFHALRAITASLGRQRRFPCLGL